MLEATGTVDSIARSAIAARANACGEQKVTRHWLLALAALGCTLALGWLVSAVAAQDVRLRLFLPHVARHFVERSLLPNGDFEAGPTGWEPGCSCITREGPPEGWRSGEWGARLGHRAGQRLRQTVAVPSGVGGLRFGYWYQYRSTAPDPFHLSDRFTVTVRDAVSGEIVYRRQVTAQEGLTAVWLRDSADLAPLQGRSLVVEFEALSPSGRTWLFVDDVELVPGSGAALPRSPTPTQELVFPEPTATPTAIATPTPGPTLTPTPLKPSPTATPTPAIVEP